MADATIASNQNAQPQPKKKRKVAGGIASKLQGTDDEVEALEERIKAKDAETVKLRAENEQLRRETRTKDKSVRAQRR